MSRRRRTACRGFSLLEVILALSILAMAVAALGELARLGMNNSRIARDLAQAQLLCESKMAEISAGISTPDMVQRAVFSNGSDGIDPTWVYSIEQEPATTDGLIVVRVTVSQDLAGSQRPVEYTLVRWMIDPAYTPPTTTPTTTTP